MPRTTDPTPAAPETEETNGHKPVSRRGVLKRAAIVAAGAGGAAMLGSRKAFAAATTQSNVVYLDTPERLLDTRAITPDGQSSSDTDVRIASQSEITVQVTGDGTPPAGNVGVPTGASGVFGNVTVATPSTYGNIIIYPSDGAPEPAAGTPVTMVVPQNMANQYLANHFASRLNAAGEIDVYWDGPGTTDVVIDVVGYIIDDDGSGT